MSALPVETGHHRNGGPARIPALCGVWFREARLSGSNGRGWFANRPYDHCTKFREQSENVDENKGKGHNVSNSGLRYLRFVALGLTTSGGINEDGFRGARALSKRELPRSFVVPLR